MPGPDTSTPSGPDAQAWQTTIKNSITGRLRADQIPFRDLAKRHRISAEDIANILLGFRSPHNGADDPLLFRYSERLLKEKLIDISDLLLALLHHSQYGSGSPSNPGLTSPMQSCEERVFNLITQTLATTGLPESTWSSHELIYSVTRWLQAATDHEMGKQLEQLDGSGIYTLDPMTYGLYEALATLAISIFANPALRKLSQQPWWKKRRATVVAKMEEFDTSVLQWMQSQLGGRLRKLAGFPPYIAMDKNGRPVFSERQILDMIPDAPVVNSRAGLFIWLDASLSARPLTDDMQMIAHLHGRYDTDSQSMVGDLLMASFDVLTNALLRKDSQQSLIVIRSFICNKLPILLSILSGMLTPPLTMETLIQIAFMSESMIPMEPLAPITPGATEIRDGLKATRLAFLQACALHGLVTESCIKAVVQNPAVGLPRVIKYSKEGLVAQCVNNVSRLEALVDELGGMQGNAGAVSGCVAETITSFCLSKDYMSLKSACTELMKKLPRLDIILQYTQPEMILLPLCTLLNDWVHDQDQTEFAPAYEEFATILLFTLATFHRYDLTYTEIGLLADNFVARLLNYITTSKYPEELSGEQITQLAKWNEGLYTVDDHGETSGIGDDVMRQCSPQSFYMLVPSLFDRSVSACHTGVLPMKTFKGGLELLLEPFLLPSLVMGLRWLTHHPWEVHNDADILIGVLDKLLKPSSSSQETQAMHKIVLAMVAKPLSDFLHYLESRRSDKKRKITELLDLLKPHLNEKRHLKCSQSEKDEWIQISGSLEAHLRQTVRELVNWASASSHPPNPPPKFTYREYVLACEALGRDCVEQILLAEVKQSTFNVSIALDVSTALACAPLPESMTEGSASHYAETVHKVRDFIRFQMSDIPSLLKRPKSDAEALVRLCKRIEAHLAAPPIPAIALPLMQDQAADQIIQDLDLTALAEGVAVDGTDPSAQLAGLDPPLDLSDPTTQELASIVTDPTAMQIDNDQIFDLDIDMGQVEQDGQQMEHLEEDIFADLDMGDMGDMGDDFSY